MVPVAFTGVTYQRPAAGLFTVSDSLPDGVVALALARLRAGALGTVGVALLAAGASTRARCRSMFDALVVVTSSRVSPGGTSMYSPSFAADPAKAIAWSMPLCSAYGTAAPALRSIRTGTQPSDVFASDFTSSQPPRTCPGASVASFQTTRTGTVAPEAAEPGPVATSRRSESGRSTGTSKASARAVCAPLRECSSTQYRAVALAAWLTTSSQRSDTDDIAAVQATSLLSACPFTLLSRPR